MARANDRRLVPWMLACAAGRAPAGDAPVAWASDDDVVDREIRWLVDAGLGPLLRHVVLAAGGALPARWQASLLSADLTARVRHGNFVIAAGDVIDACRASGVVPTLLKGIAIAARCYPRPHLRPMSDVDVLVPAHAYEAVEAELVQRGFVASGDTALHHGVPLWHPTAGVRVELHTALFGSDSILGRARPFLRDELARDAVAATFEEREVRLLSPETHFVYVAATLMADLVRHGLDPTFLPTMADAVLLLRETSTTFDWRRVATMLDDGMARDSTWLLAGYLARCGLADVPGQAAAELGARQGLAAPLRQAAFRFMMDRYFLGARRWDLPLPPPVPGRYDLRRQIEGRILRRRRGILEPG